MALSKDPAKRKAQLENLRVGRERAARSLLGLPTDEPVGRSAEKPRSPSAAATDAAAAEDRLEYGKPRQRTPRTGRQKKREPRKPPAAAAADPGPQAHTSATLPGFLDGVRAGFGGPR